MKLDFRVRKYNGVSLKNTHRLEELPIEGELAKVFPQPEGALVLEREEAVFQGVWVGLVVVVGLDDGLSISLLSEAK
jgi:hypothetical protein